MTAGGWREFAEFNGKSFDLNRHAHTHTSHALHMIPSPFLPGSPESLIICIRQICSVMLKNPPRGPYIPYMPDTQPNQEHLARTNVSVVLCGGHVTCRFGALYYEWSTIISSHSMSKNSGFIRCIDNINISYAFFIMTDNITNECTPTLKTLYLLRM